MAVEIDPLGMIPSKSKYSMDRMDPADLPELPSESAAAVAARADQVLAALVEPDDS